MREPSAPNLNRSLNPGPQKNSPSNSIVRENQIKTSPSGPRPPLRIQLNAENTSALCRANFTEKNFRKSSPNPNYSTTSLFSEKNSSNFQAYSPEKENNNNLKPNSGSSE